MQLGTTILKSIQIDHSLIHTIRKQFTNCIDLSILSTYFHGFGCLRNVTVIILCNTVQLLSKLYLLVIYTDFLIINFML